MKKNLTIIYVLLFGLSLAGCATQEYVDKKVQALRDDLYGPAKFGTSLPIRVWREPSIDKNGNSKISLKELKKRLKEIYDTQLKPIDFNSDGKISSQEYIEYKKSGSMLLIYKDMDVNGDGAINRDEFDSFNKNIFLESLRLYDSDNDKQISKEEFYQYNETILFEADFNKNGVIEKSEVINKPGLTPRFMPEERKVTPIMCGPGCEYIPATTEPWPSPGNGEGRPVGYCEAHPGASWCPSPSHPGCTNNDVATGNCVCIWSDYCIPFW